MHRTWLMVVSAMLAVFASTNAHAQTKLPNILWITCEDMGPHLGCYGDKYSTSPNIDRLAARSLRYRVCWSNAPVCAPARTTIISGMYPPATGSEHMRSMTRLPDSISMFPVYLRRLGYYCTNNVKEDYNLEKGPATPPKKGKGGGVWDDSSNKAHWKNRAAGQPFFAVFNFTITHESQIRTRPHKLVHDPSKVRVPAYHPDTPEVRHDWAQYYDNITVMDKQVGAVLRELAEAGLLENTIVFFYSDHGSGMPRNKRWPYDSGLHVPLIVHIPAQFASLAPKDYASGAESNRLVSFVDLAPTLLSLAGSRPPEHMQGEAFLGPHAAQPRQYVHGFRGRMDERYDFVRSVRDERYVYIRNYMPHKIQGQHLDYMWQTPTTPVWEKLFKAGKLNDAQAFFWKPRPPEELYDLDNDRDEVNNLVGSAKHQDILKRLREAHKTHVFKVRDLGFLPESGLHRRSEGSTPYEMGRDDKKYPLGRIFAMADAASMLQDGPQLQKGLRDDDAAVRYWAALGVLMRGPKAVEASSKELHQALGDQAAAVRIVAAEALGKYGTKSDLDASLNVLGDLVSQQKHGAYVSIQALNAVGELGRKATPLLSAIQDAEKGSDAVNARMKTYVPRLVEKLVADLKGS